MASVLCRSGAGVNLGYPGALYGDESDFGPVESGDGLYNLSCPGSYWSDYDCTYTVTYGNGCNDYNEPALITCLAGEYLLYLLSLLWILFFSLFPYLFLRIQGLIYLGGRGG